MKKYFYKDIIISSICFLIPLFILIKFDTVFIGYEFAIDGFVIAKTLLIIYTLESLRKLLLNISDKLKK